MTVCLILASRLFALFKLAVNMSLWPLNVSFFYRGLSLGSFFGVTRWIFWPRIFAIILFFDRKIISSVLSGIREILLAPSQRIMFSSQSLLFCLCLLWTYWHILINLVSSAKKCMSEYVTTMLVTDVCSKSMVPWCTSSFISSVLNSFREIRCKQLKGIFSVQVWQEGCPT